MSRKVIVGCPSCPTRLEIGRPDRATIYQVTCPCCGQRSNIHPPSRTVVATGQARKVSPFQVALLVPGDIAAVSDSSSSSARFFSPRVADPWSPTPLPPASSEDHSRGDRLLWVAAILVFSAALVMLAATIFAAVAGG